MFQVPHLHILNSSRDGEPTNAWPTLSGMKRFLKSYLNMVWGNLRPSASYSITFYLEKEMDPTLLKPPFKSDLRMFLPCPLWCGFIQLCYTHTWSGLSKKGWGRVRYFFFFIHAVFLCSMSWFSWFWSSVKQWNIHMLSWSNFKQCSESTSNFCGQISWHFYL